jgi:hypothetical protein
MRWSTTACATAPGFSSQEWKVAYNQVKALSVIASSSTSAPWLRFARFGYGHHTAAALTVLLRVGPEVFVKWLAMQDYVAITVALKACPRLSSPTCSRRSIASLPWRDLPSEADLQTMVLQAGSRRSSKDEAVGIFELWRAHCLPSSGPSAKTAPR